MLRCIVVSLAWAPVVTRVLDSLVNQMLDIKCLGICAVQDQLSVVAIFPGLLVCNLYFDLVSVFTGSQAVVGFLVQKLFTSIL